MAASEDATFAFGTWVLAHPAIPMIPTADTPTAAQYKYDFMLSLFRSSNSS
jgi:hypothetical protein